MLGKRPSGSWPLRVYTSVSASVEATAHTSVSVARDVGKMWGHSRHRALHTTLTRTSPALGGATTISASRMSLTPKATIALHVIGWPAVATSSPAPRVRFDIDDDNRWIDTSAVSGRVVEK